MLAAPEDLRNELDVMADVILAWNDANSRARKVVLLPMDFRAQAIPEVGDPPQSIINRQLLEHCDILIAAFWTRLGSPTGTHISGTVEEIDRHVKAGKPALVYFSRAKPELEQIDAKQLTAVRQFETEIRNAALCGEFDSAERLRATLNRHLSKLMNENPYVQATLNWHSNLLEVAAGPRRELSDLARRMLCAAAKGNGLIDRREHLRGLHIGAGREEFTEKDNARSEADAEASLEELEQAGLVQDRTGERRIFHVTKLGYVKSDSLSSRKTPGAEEIPETQ